MGLVEDTKPPCELLFAQKECDGSMSRLRSTFRGAGVIPEVERLLEEGAPEVIRSYFELASFQGKSQSVVTYRALGSENLQRSMIWWRYLTFPGPKVLEHAPETIIGPSNVQSSIEKLWWGSGASTRIATLC